MVVWWLWGAEGPFSWCWEVLLLTLVYVIIHRGLGGLGGVIGCGASFCGGCRIEFWLCWRVSRRILGRLGDVR